MDNETKLSASGKDALQELLQHGGDAPDTVDDFVNTHLSSQQKDAFRQLLKDPARMKAMLASPQAKALFEKLRRKEPDNT